MLGLSVKNKEDVNRKGFGIVRQWEEGDESGNGLSC